jgi:glucosylceramidase
MLRKSYYTTLRSASISLLLFHCTCMYSQYKGVCTTDLQRWTEIQPINANVINDDYPCDASIDFSQKEQVIDGWGGCFNEKGWDALSVLSEAQRDIVIKHLFDAKEGANFTLCRTPMGANDYGLKWYSYDETPKDFSMKKFSIENDKKTLIPYIKAAQKYSPSLKVWASPWSPPSWMKINNHYACVPSGNNGMKPEQSTADKSDQFRLEDAYLTSYALYFAKYVENYKKQGIDIYAVHVQNEPFFHTVYPGCVWKPASLALFIQKYLKPMFVKHNLSTEIWLGTFNNGNFNVFDEVLKKKDFRDVISGIGLQWAGKNAIGKVHSAYPEMRMMQTESECGYGSFDWNAAEHTYNLIAHYLNNGANSYIYWNMVLDDTGLSTWGWKQNALTTINRQTKNVVYTPEYYVMMHFSKFVLPGSVKVKTYGPYTNILAFVTPQGKRVVVVYNPNTSDKSVCVRCQNKVFSVKMPPRSITTLYEE